MDAIKFVSWHLVSLIFFLVSNLKASSGEDVGLNENATSITATNNASESSNLISTTELTTTKKPSNEKQVIDYSEDYPVKQVERCYFAEDITNASIEILSKRCQRAISGKSIWDMGQNNVYINDRRCGIRLDDDDGNITTNITDELLTKNSLCFSTADQNIAKQFIQELYLPDEVYESDFADVTKKLFKSTKLAMEYEWNELYMSSPLFQEHTFDSIIILNMKKGKNGNERRQKRAIPTIIGVNVTAMIRFGKNGTNLKLDDYFVEFDRLLNFTVTEQNKTIGRIGHYQVDGKLTAPAKEPPKCKSLQALKEEMPIEIWTSSGFDENDTVEMGKTIELSCPKGLSLSFDNDNFNPYDDRYTVLCSTRLSYLAPKKKEDWPRCVKACWRKLPPVPVETGLSQQWTRPNKIPAGRYGYYRCIDQSHGMGPFISEHVKEKGGPRNFYSFKCNDDGNYDIPKNLIKCEPGSNQTRCWGDFETWINHSLPVCAARTTTVSPVINMALRKVLMRHQQTLEYRILRWKFEQNFVPTPRENWMQKVTLPSSLAIGTLVLLVLIVTRVDSPLCKICAEHREVDKTFVPIVDENESQRTEKHDDMDHESVVSIDTEMEENSANHSFVDPIERQDSGNDVDNIEVVNDTNSIDQISIISKDKSETEKMTPN